MPINKVVQDKKIRNPENGEIGKYVERLTKLGKGIPADPEAYLFYRMFLHDEKLMRIIYTVDDVRRTLHESFLDEEDIRQECWVLVLKYAPARWYKAEWNILWDFRDRLISGLKVFHEQRKDWQEKYQVYRKMLHEELQQDLRTHKLPFDSTVIWNKNPYWNLSELSLYNRYLIFCMSQGYSTNTIARLSNRERKSQIQELKTLRENIKQQHDLGKEIL